MRSKIGLRELVKIAKAKIENVEKKEKGVWSNKLHKGTVLQAGILGPFAGITHSMSKADLGPNRRPHISSKSFRDGSGAGYAAGSAGGMAGAEIAGATMFKRPKRKLYSGKE